MVETITFDTENNRLGVAFEDGTVREYTDRATYVADFPDREADCDAMGWY
jgi:hypothetical protein